MPTVTRLHGRPRKPCRRPYSVPRVVVPAGELAARRDARRFAAALAAETRPRLLAGRR